MNIEGNKVNHRYEQSGTKIPRNIVIMHFLFDLLGRQKRKGMSFMIVCIVLCEERKTEDESRAVEGETPYQRLAWICNPIMNTIHSNLKLTTEVSVYFPDGRLPSLDFMMGMVYLYFEQSKYWSVCNGRATKLCHSNL